MQIKSAISNKSARKHDGERALRNGLSTPSTFDNAQGVVAELEKQLHQLDRLGAHKAGAHLDAAIQQLRRDMAACQRSDPESVMRKTISRKGVQENSTQQSLRQPLDQAYQS